MKKFYKLLIFTVCFFVIQQLIGFIFAGNSYSYNFKSAFFCTTKIIVLVGTAFLCGYFYANLFQEKLSVKKALGITFFTRLLVFLSFAISYAYVYGMKINSIDSVMHGIYSWAFWLFLLTIMLRWGADFYFTKNIISKNPWLLGIHLLIVYWLIVTMLSVFLLTSSNVVSLFFSTIFLVLTLLSFLFLVWVLYAKRFPVPLSFLGSLKIVSIFSLIVGFFSLLQGFSFGYKAMVNFLGGFIANIIFFVPIVYLFAVFFRWRSKAHFREAKANELQK
ncbi:MAG: hypothetical protein P4L31_02210 [Candidatus Babeliales bacterium]|nr:hypothetical protein [Candidatus Babeliales bacterium]